MQTLGLVPFMSVLGSYDWVKNILRRNFGWKDDNVLRRLSVYVCVANFNQKFYQTDSGDNMPIRFSSGHDEHLVSFLMVNFSH